MNTTASKTGPPKGYRDGENNITASTMPEQATTPAVQVSVSTATSSTSSSSSSSSSRRGEDTKGPFDTRTTTPKMKTTRIDTSNEFDYNFTTLLTTTQRTTFPVTMVTEPMKELDQTTTMGARDFVTTMFPVITPPATKQTTERPTIAGTTTPFVYETIEPITTMSTTAQTEAAITTTITSSAATTTEPGTTNKYLTTETATTAATTPTSTSTDITMINICTDHTNCGSSQLCVLGMCRNKCRDGDTSDTECAKGIHLVASIFPRELSVRKLHDFRLSIVLNCLCMLDLKGKSQKYSKQACLCVQKKFSNSLQIFYFLLCKQLSPEYETFRSFTKKYVVLCSLGKFYSAIKL